MPTHLTLLVYAGIDEAVGGAFSRRTGYRRAGPVSPTVVDDRSFILEQVSAKIANQGKGQNRRDGLRRHFVQRWQFRGAVECRPPPQARRR